MWTRVLEAVVPPWPTASGAPKVRFVIDSDGVNEPEVRAYAWNGTGWDVLPFIDDFIDHEAEDEDA